LSNARAIARIRGQRVKTAEKFFEFFSKKPLTVMRIGSTNTLVSCQQCNLQTRYCGLKGGILDAR